MDIIFLALTILGLSLFEVITSIDNAIINAEVLGGMSQRARRWFLLYGFFFAVFVVRGLLPFLIVWVANPSIGPLGVITAAFSNDPHVVEAIEKSSPLLLMGGGVFLIFLFFSWLFLEPKNFGLRGEKFFHSQGAWFFAVVSVLLAVIGLVRSAGKLDVGLCCRSRVDCFFYHPRVSAICTTAGKKVVKWWYV